MLIISRSIRPIIIIIIITSYTMEVSALLRRELTSTTSIGFTATPPVGRRGSPFFPTSQRIFACRKFLFFSGPENT